MIVPQELTAGPVVVGKSPAKPGRQFVRKHAGLWLLLVAYVAVSVLYGVRIPIFESPDANGHYAYIHELTEGHGLPVQGSPSGRRVTGYVASHPPLYYALCAALTFWVPDDVDFDDWAWRNPHHAMGFPGSVANKNYLVHTPAEQFPWRGTPLTMHIARFVSTALCALAVCGTYGIALQVFPNRRWLALGAGALTAFNPMFVFTAARVSNDAAVTAFGSLVIWGAVMLAVRGLSRRGLALTGATLGLAVLSKLSGVILAPVVAFALFLHALRGSRFVARRFFRKRQLVRLLVDALTIFGTSAVICCWWLGRNLVLYGELMGVSTWLSHTGTVRLEPIGLLGVVRELQGLEMSYWAMFGWFNVPVASWLYRLWWVLARLAMLGLVLVVVDHWKSRRAARSAHPVDAGPCPGRAEGLLVLAFAFLLVFSSVCRFIAVVLGSQGRYLMPVVAPISVLLILGLSRLVWCRWTRGLAALLGGGHLILALLCLFSFVLPAYSAPKVVPESELPQEMVRFDLTFDGTPVQLLGGTIDADEAHPGDSIPVALYWQAVEPPQENFVAFAQILGRDMEPIAGVDCYPGRGNFPPTLWRPEVVYRDEYVLPLASDIEVPTIAALHAGLHALGGRRLAIRSSPDGPTLDLVLLDSLPVRPAQPLSDEVTHPVGARLGEAIKLVGYEISAEEVQPGEPFTVTVVWSAEASPDRNYTAFVHLIDASGTLVAQKDHPPLGGAYPTTFWIPGDVTRDTYRLTVDEAVPPDAHTLTVGMYDPETGTRLPAYDGLGVRFKNDAITAGKVIVQ